MIFIIDESSIKGKWFVLGLFFLRPLRRTRSGLRLLLQLRNNNP